MQIPLLSSAGLLLFSLPTSYATFGRSSNGNNNNGNNNNNNNGGNKGLSSSFISSVAPSPTAVAGGSTCSAGNDKVQQYFSILAGNKDAQGFCQSRYGTAIVWAGSGQTKTPARDGTINNAWSSRNNGKKWSVKRNNKGKDSGAQNGNDQKAAEIAE